MLKVKQRFRALGKKLRSKLSRRRLIYIGAALIFAFLAVNLVGYLVFKDRTYPLTYINGYRIGMTRFSDTGGKISQAGLLPENFQVDFNGQASTHLTKAWGIGVDEAKTRQDFQNRHVLPLVNLITGHKLSLSLKLEAEKFNKELDNLSAVYTKAPTDAQISLQGTDFIISPEKPGQTLDESLSKQAILEALSRGQARINLPVKITEPSVKENDLLQLRDTYKKQQSTSITFRYLSQSRQVTTEEITGWYVNSDGDYQLSEDHIRRSLIEIGSSFGIRIKNLAEAVNATMTALQNTSSLSFRLQRVEPVSKTYTYCVAAKGVDSSYLAEFENKLHQVYSDSRGWGLKGQISFKKVSSGCSFTAWLSEASQMSSFGAICDSDWSCRVGVNVVINFDRWRYASTAWNSAGGSLDDYRSMVINHETGHWLGFGHSNCGGAGQAAPVMQQQSISLQGCAFNPWPLASEITSLRNNLGL